MKQKKVFSLILRIFMVLSFLIFSFSSFVLSEEKLDAKKERIKKCLRCCDYKYLECININPDRRLCAAENQTCAETCKSEGVSLSEWRDCWTQSE
jgi:hypothetical protein